MKLESSHPPELMEEDKEHPQRTNIFGGKHEKVEIAAAEGSPVGHLVMNSLVRHYPPHIDTREETAQRKQYVGREEIEEIEK